MTRGLRHLLHAALAMIAGCVATPLWACTVLPSASTIFDPYSPAAVKAAAVPALKSQAGLTCVPSVIVLLSMNYINAKFHSNNSLKFVQKDAQGNVVGSIAYSAAADPNNAVPFAQDATVNYMQNNLLNVLGLLGGSSANFPFYVKPTGGALPPTGVYTDRVTITWNWYLCQGVSALFVCLGTPDSGSATTTIDLTLTVTPVSMVITTASATTWDALNGTSNPRAIPSSRRRTTLTVKNPDVVALDSNAVAIVVPVPSGETLALDGDGTGTSISLVDGSPSSGLSLTYASPSSQTDDVDFSTDLGSTWAYSPIAGDSASQGLVNAIRLRPKGTMAAGSSFSITLPFTVN